MWNRGKLGRILLCRHLSHKPSLQVWAWARGEEGSGEREGAVFSLCTVRTVQIQSPALCSAPPLRSHLASLGRRFPPSCLLLRRRICRCCKSRRCPAPQRHASRLYHRPSSDSGAQAAAQRQQEAAAVRHVGPATAARGSTGGRSGGSMARL